MMLAWSACEPPNGYGVTNCSSLSGNALAALVSTKAADAVVASEAIDRRVVMISLYATTFLRSPRHRRRLAFGNRQGPSLEVGDVLHLLLHAVQQTIGSKPAVGPRRLQCLVARKQSSSGHRLRKSNPRGHYGISGPLKLPHCGLMPAIFTTLSH